MLATQEKIKAMLKYYLVIHPINVPFDMRTWGIIHFSESTEQFISLMLVLPSDMVCFDHFLHLIFTKVGPYNKLTSIMHTDQALFLPVNRTSLVFKNCLVTW